MIIYFCIILHYFFVDFESAYTLFCVCDLIEYKMMDCKQAVSMIPAYLEDSLEADELKAFLEHIDSCPECSEELSIQFLITEGLNTLNNGDSYDLTSAMKQKVEESHRDISFHDKLFWIRNVAVGLVLIMIMAAIAAVNYFYFG